MLRREASTISKLHETLAWFDALTGRERLIIFVAVLSMTILAWFIATGEAAFKEHSREQVKLATAKASLADAQTELKVKRAAGGDPLVDVKAQLESVRARSAKVQETIDEYAAELISPTEMAQMLESVLSRQKSLTLVRLANADADDLMPTGGQGAQGLYRHRFEMELEGPYLACLAYLEDLEKLPWRMYWQALDIEVIEYPKTRIRIDVATLSLDEDWIGV